MRFFFLSSVQMVTERIGVSIHKLASSQIVAAEGSGESGDRKCHSRNPLKWLAVLVANL